MISYNARNQRIEAWVNAAAEESEDAAPTDPEARDLHDQEKAQRIEHEDLCRDKKQTYKGAVLLWLAWQTTGVVYGDIGTSPLYVFSSTFSEQPSWHDLVGALSIIIWSLTIIVTLKYCFIVLSADDDGQGGTFALYSLLARYANIARVDPNGPERIVVRLDRETGAELAPAGRMARDFLERSRVAQSVLKIVGVLGVSMVVADSILTPAQSVLGAVQGIQVIRPDLGRPAIVGTSCAILIALFLLQFIGTSKIGTSFAPVVVVWLLYNFSISIYNLVLYDHTVLKAFSPHYAFKYLIRNDSDGWKSLGGLLLAFTGVESLFADLGAFGQRAIQLSWLFLAFPCLLITYCGQAAYISQDETGLAFTNPFFRTVPESTLYFSIIIAALAAVVASQAVITSSFQLISQLMRLSYFPHIKTVHTSRRFHDQIYMPLANWLLMTGTVVVTAVYNNTTSLGHAYGACVIIVSFITTCMVSLVALIIWRISSIVVLIGFLIFILLDSIYLSAAMNKVPDGGWFALVLSAILSSSVMLWRWGKEQQWEAEQRDMVDPAEFLMSSRSTSRNNSIARGIQGEGSLRSTRLRLSPEFGGGQVMVAPGLGIFFDKVGGSGDHIPKVFSQFVRKFQTRPQVIVFFHMRPLSQPTVPSDQRFVIARVTTKIPSCYRIVLRHGYMDDVLTPNLAPTIVNELMTFITRGPFPPDENDMPPEFREELEALRAAEEAQTVYLMGKQTMRVQRPEKRSISSILRRVALEAFLWIRENSRTKLANLDIDPDSLVEVGFVKEI
ncbi:potassium uptake protein [Fusarium oxysporum f. sp. lycopersici 4287]|uniref:Potassium uptake protein n=3 Tax=Fusarium oxysporum TaxID=5507 RepID=A0A0J9UYJ9_FUSO4|nr:potassium uptake protein [Fusarium oxysporum f. sp. lycopersici 4287]EXK35451.1 potassium uptake protein [Fusarium oxysporum f. sp. melonis 26406]KAJ9423479.1 potassium uptake protein [Fusarium oxysporum]KNB03998.1 potassium uptake protein [Fusarium oxysporum f. sp. lycopersici 4287]